MLANLCAPTAPPLGILIPLIELLPLSALVSPLIDPLPRLCPALLASYPSSFLSSSSIPTPLSKRSAKPLWLPLHPEHCHRPFRQDLLQRGSTAKPWHSLSDYRFLASTPGPRSRSFIYSTPPRTPYFVVPLFTSSIISIHPTSAAPPSQPQPQHPYLHLHHVAARPLSNS